MVRIRPAVRSVAAAAVVLLAGCTGLAPTAADDGTEPTATPVAADQPSSTPETDNTTATELRQPRYLSLEPTCERPPGLVIHIQVQVLRTNDPATNEGMATAWRFASPSNRQLVGPYEAFVDTLESGYQPLLNADSVTYGPLEREGTTATREVTVTADGESTTYEWRVVRQSEPPYEGCWMTFSVREV